MTLHLPSSLVDGGSSKVDKMSYTHPNSILSIAMSSMSQREDMRKNQFLYFDYFTSENPCDSSTSPRDNFWPVTPKNYFETWVFSFSPKSSIFFQISIEVTFWLVNLEKSPLGLEQLSWAQVGNFSRSWRRIKCQIYTYPIFRSVLVSCVNLADQIFMSSYFT